MREERDDKGGVRGGPGALPSEVRDAIASEPSFSLASWLFGFVNQLFCCSSLPRDCNPSPISSTHQCNSQNFASLSANVSLHCSNFSSARLSLSILALLPTIASSTDHFVSSSASVLGPKSHVGGFIPSD